jgi:hypothetical protein
LVARVLPTWRMLNMLGALMSNQSFFKKGSTLRGKGKRQSSNRACWLDGSTLAEHQRNCGHKLRHVLAA